MKNTYKLADPEDIVECRQFEQLINKYHSKVLIPL